METRLLNALASTSTIEAGKRLPTPKISPESSGDYVVEVYDPLLISKENMDRIARQHPIYNQSKIINETMSSPQNTIKSDILIEYTCKTIQKCTELLSFIDKNHKDLFDINNDTKECYFDTLLQDSIFGIILRSIITALRRRQYGINKKLPTSKISDKLYRRRDGKKDRKFVIESKHPYPIGKNQLKETVIIPGAKSLSVHFDPQSRTSSSSQDVLQYLRVLH
jgi:hypothetical protein